MNILLPTSSLLSSISLIKENMSPVFRLTLSPEIQLLNICQQTLAFDYVITSSQLMVKKTWLKWRVSRRGHVNDKGASLSK
jgi:hypothetical protein